MKNETNKSPITLTKRIGGAVYEVNCFFSPEAKESVEEKLWRMLKNDLTTAANCAILKVSQTARLPERSTV